MAGDAPDPAELAKLKGLSKHFNGITVTGRANVAKATYLSLALIGFYFYFKPKKATS